MTGLAPRNIRLVEPEQQENEDVIVENDPEDGEKGQFDDKGNLITIEHDDGSISISLSDKPIEEAEDPENPAGWFDNLVEKIDQMELSAISEELLRGVRDDLSSRKDWIEDRAQGIKLLGLKLEIPGLAGVADGAPVEGMSKVRHPLLLEAVLRFQANARGELLPVDGPVKIRNDTPNSTLKDDNLANALERDMNHYLTSTAKEYYPDTDRMLFMLGFGGTAFKKVYFCPLRNRPVSETVDADDLIVNNAATDLSNALRVTHRLYMKPSTVRRMQLIGAYRDIELSIPNASELDAVQREQQEQQGLMSDNFNPDDRDREIYEIYCELDIKGFEHKKRGKVTGLAIPYRVTIDVSSKEILSIVRNYDENTADLPEARKTFVKYSFVPGMGFYDIGLLHILGNTTNAVTAAWRELLDAGMYANFPGFLFSDAGGRQNTNIFRVPPGGGAMVKTGGLPIEQAVTALPYKEPSQALMALVDNMATTGMRVGGTAEMQVAEGRGDVPVGTILAQIEQAMKILNAVHKRMHSSQAEEFQLLVDCFSENPESFWVKNRKPTYPWTEETFLEAVKDADLVPQADPNTASYPQRVMKVMALKQLQAANPTLYDPVAIDMAALQAIGWSNPQQFMAPVNAMGQPTPADQAKLMEVQLKQQAQQIDAANKAAEIQTKQQENTIKMMDMQIKAGESQFNQKKDSDDALLKREEMVAKERIQMIDLAQNIAVHPESEDEIKRLLGNVIPEITQGGQ